MAIPAELQEILSSALPESGSIDVDDVRQRIRKLQDKHAATLAEIAEKQAADLASAREQAAQAQADLEGRVAELETTAAGAVEAVDPGALQKALSEQEEHLTGEHEAAITRLRREKDLTLEALETDARQQLELLSQEHQAAMEAKEAEYRAEIERMEQAHQEALTGAVSLDETDGGALLALEENWKAKVAAAEQALTDASTRFQHELEEREAKNASFIAQLQNENRAQTALLKQNQGSAKELDAMRKRVAELEGQIEQAQSEHGTAVEQAAESARAQMQGQLDELNASHSDEIADKDEEIRRLAKELVEAAQNSGGIDPAEMEAFKEQTDVMRLEYEQRIRELEAVHRNEMMDMREALDETFLGSEADVGARTTNVDIQSMQAMVEQGQMQMLEAMQTVAKVEAEGQRKLQELRDQHREEREQLKKHLTTLSQAYRNSQTNDPSAIEKIGQIIALLLSQYR